MSNLNSKSLKYHARGFPTNQQRADWAAQALGAFPPALPGSKSGLSRQELIGDLVANLLHLARRDKIDPLPLVERAVMNLIAEEEALGHEDIGPEVDVAVMIIVDGEDYYALGKRGREHARRKRLRRLESGGGII
jgi:hypothetical protein